MAVTHILYGQSVAKAFNKEIDFDSDTIKVALVKSTYVPLQDTHAYLSDVVLAVNEATGTGYTAGGATLGGKSVTYDGATNTVKLDADDAVWANSTITARYAVVYDATPASDATRPLISLVDFGADVSSTNGEFRVTWAAAGVATVVVS